MCSVGLCGVVCQPNRLLAVSVYFTTCTLCPCMELEPFKALCFASDIENSTETAALCCLRYLGSRQGRWTTHSDGAEPAGSVKLLGLEGWHHRRSDFASLTPRRWPMAICSTDRADGAKHDCGVQSRVEVDMLATHDLAKVLKQHPSCIRCPSRQARSFANALVQPFDGFRNPSTLPSAVCVGELQKREPGVSCWRIGTEDDQPGSQPAG